MAFDLRDRRDVTVALSSSLEVRFQEALALQQSGCFREAEEIYREILAANPDHHPTLHFYGLLAHQCQQNGPALEMLRKAISLESGIPEYHNNCGAVFYALHQLDEAGRCYRRAVELNPAFPEAQNNLGNVLLDSGHLDEAEVCYRRALDLDPRMAAACNNLGNIERKKRRFESAGQFYQKALVLNPAYAEAHQNLGCLAKDGGNLSMAEQHFRNAIRSNPSLIEAYRNLGEVLKATGREDEARACFQKLSELFPPDAGVQNQLGVMLKGQGRYAEAIQAHFRAVKINPRDWQGFNHLGTLFHELGKLPEAADCYRKAISLQPDKAFLRSNLLFSLNHAPDCTPEQLFEEHLDWGKRFTKEHPVPSFTQSRDPDRRLRIGYLMPDFRRQAVAFSMEPFLSAHDHSQVEIFFYSFVPQPEEVKTVLKQMSDQWREVSCATDDEAAEMIQEDQIDILLDVMGHTGETRLELFTRRVAPVQVSYLGYVNTTGLSTMDYRISDAHGDPEGMTERYYTEKIFRLPETSIVFHLPELIPVTQAPALKNGYVTFGSFNNLSKVTPEVVELWSRVLKVVPEAHLLIKSPCLVDPEVRKYVGDMFLSQGVDVKRLEFVGYVSSYKEHLRLYEKVDVALDPFPFNGGLTSMEALWMGVPVVTLVGNSFVSRLSVRLLVSVKLTDWMTDSKEAYVRKAVDAAMDVMRLNDLRQSLREKVKTSPISDGVALARNLEAAFREMWRKECVSRE